MNSKGFVLLEVLIGLLIIAIALGALIETNTSVIRHISLIEDKTEALWVAQNIEAQLQTGLIELPSRLDTLSGEMNMLKDQWYWEANFEVTEDKSGLKVTIDVKPEKNSESVLELITYIIPKVNK